MWLLNPGNFFGTNWLPSRLSFTCGLLMSTVVHTWYLKNRNFLFPKKCHQFSNYLTKSGEFCLTKLTWEFIFSWKSGGYLIMVPKCYAHFIHVRLTEMLQSSKHFLHDCNIWPLSLFPGCHPVFPWLENSPSMESLFWWQTKGQVKSPTAPEGQKAVIISQVWSLDSGPL